MGRYCQRRGRCKTFLYDQLTMLAALAKAHNELNKVVNLAYRQKLFTIEANRMEFLFELYEKYTADLFYNEKTKKEKIMIHISNVKTKSETLTYWRNPTKAEIRFGHGATHYRDFEFEKCFDEDGYQKLKVKACDDNLVYYYSGLEYYSTSNAKQKLINI